MASFFNLTALGPDNVFKAASLRQTTLHLFAEDELKLAFDAISKENDSILPSDVPDVLIKMYHGPPPPGDTKAIIEALPDSKIQWTNLRNAFVVAKEKVSCEKDLSSAEKYESYQEYSDLTRRHVRKRLAPKDSLGKPLTSSQDFGWTVDMVDGLPHKIHGKRSCPETMYASELVKSGIIF